VHGLYDAGRKRPEGNDDVLASGLECLDCNHGTSMVVPRRQLTSERAPIGESASQD
jgi:hypothetical protein